MVGVEAGMVGGGASAMRPDRTVVAACRRLAFWCAAQKETDVS
jgi:hypothetical protein